VKNLLLASLVAMVGFATTAALAQAQAEEKMLVGEVQNVNEAGTEIMLTDGTTLLLTPPGSTIRSGALERGTLVVVVYLEQEDGNKILTRLSLRPSPPVSTPAAR
jgi:hypothetical protein